VSSASPGSERCWWYTWCYCAAAILLLLGKYFFQKSRTVSFQYYLIVFLPMKEILLSVWFHKEDFVLASWLGTSGRFHLFIRGMYQLLQNHIHCLYHFLCKFFASCQWCLICFLPAQKFLFSQLLVFLLIAFDLWLFPLLFLYQRLAEFSTLPIKLV
jgi:hypothetical protein